MHQGSFDGEKKKRFGGGNLLEDGSSVTSTAQY
jgi:hypothetical protein